MVTEPDLRSADEAAEYLIRLRQLLRWIGVSEADMEKGNLRCAGNVSIRPIGADYLNPKTEIKNVNSIEALRDAINKEISRQIHEVENGRTIHSWTLEWDEDAGVLRKMRSKETEADYRYFREPDLLPIRMPPEWKASILENLPELPLDRRARFSSKYTLPEYDSDIQTSERSLSDYFEDTLKAYGGDPKKVSNWIMNDVLRMINEMGIPADKLKLTPAYLADILRMVDEKKINNATGKALLNKVQEGGKSPIKIVEDEGLAQVSDDSAIRAICQQLIADSPAEVESFRGGKETLLGWFVGQVMKKMGGKADPKLARQVLMELLKG